VTETSFADSNPGDSHSSKTANIIARTHDKTKVNDLTYASEMVLKFIELHYVG